MTHQGAFQKNPHWKYIGRFFLEWVKSLGLFAFIVSVGTFLYLFASIVVGYLPYSDRPGPGWHRTAFNWREMEFFLGFTLFLAYTLLFFGVSFFPFARLLGWFRSPRWLIRVCVGAFAGIAGFIAVSGAGWYIALADAAQLAGAASGIFYGAIVLPRFSGQPRIGSPNWKQWTGITAAILACGLLVASPLIPREPEESLEVLFVKIVNGPQKLSDDKSAAQFAPQELQQLNSLGLTGTLSFGQSTYNGPTPTDSRMLIIFTGELHCKTALRVPRRSHVMYVQQGDTWTMYPPDTPTRREKNQV